MISLLFFKPIQTNPGKLPRDSGASRLSWALRPSARQNWQASYHPDSAVFRRNMSVAKAIAERYIKIEA
jgi:hypothetical protein